jgi:predicted acyltransferase
MNDPMFRSSIAELAAGQSAPRPAQPTASPQPGSRVLSLDAMRGFTLFVAFFCAPIVRALSATPSSGARDFLIRQLTHTRWNGISFLDLGYPAFLCISGISLSLSMARRLGRGQSKRSIFGDLAKKAALCIGFAFFFNGGFSIPWSRIDFEQVFFIYALAIFVAGTVALVCGARTQVALVLLLAGGYSAAMVWGDRAFFGTNPQLPSANFDTIVAQEFPTHLLFFYFWFFPRMLLPCLCGLLLGRIDLSARTPRERVWRLAVAGVCLSNAGALLDLLVPFNRVLWTPSYVLFSVGMTCFFLAAFAQIIEVWQIRSLAMPGVVFGGNTLASWAAYHLLPFDNFARRAAGDVLVPLLGAYNGVLLAFVQVGLCWLCFYWLYQRGIRIRL